MYSRKVLFITKCVGLPSTILAFVKVFHGMVVLPGLFALSANIRDGFEQSGSVRDEDAQTPGSGELPNILSKGPPQSGNEEVQCV